MKRLIWAAVIILGVMACSDDMNEIEEAAKQESRTNEVGNFWD